MSYIRCAWPLRYFKGRSTLYVYGSSDGIEDYDTDYSDNESFCELMGNFVESATGDARYAEKMVRILAKKIGIENRLLPKPRTSSQVTRLMKADIERDDKIHNPMRCKRCGEK
mgnify:CR=1 FL=1